MRLNSERNGRPLSLSRKVSVTSLKAFSWLTRFLAVYFVVHFLIFVFLQPFIGFFKSGMEIAVFV